MWKSPISTGQARERKLKLKPLVAVMGFVRDDEDDLQPAFEPREVVSEEKARMEGRRMAALGTWAGATTRSRTTDLINGEFGEPVVLLRTVTCRRWDGPGRRAADAGLALPNVLAAAPLIEPSRPLDV